MPRPITLFTAPWSDLPLEEVVQRAADWGYDGLEVCCWGSHFEVQRAASEGGYCQHLIELASRHELSVSVISNHPVGQAVGDAVDQRHRARLPEYVWGGGEHAEVSQRAAAEMAATARAAQQVGAGVVAGLSGSPLTPAALDDPLPASTTRGLLAEFARRWQPILDVFAECGVRFACEVRPGQAAFDIPSAEAALEALGGRDEFGFLFDPGHLHWQGIDPVEFLRRFGDRIYHVHANDARLNLNGRAGVLNGYLPPGHPDRGWEYRAPGRGGVDWEAVVRGLNEVGYQGPISLDWKDAGIDRDWGAEDACRFLRRLEFPAPRHDAGPPEFE